MSFNLPILVHNSAAPTLAAGASAPLQGDASGNLLVNQRLTTSADVITAVQPTAQSLNAVVWVYDGAGNPIASYPATGGGTYLLKVDTADLRNIIAVNTAITASGNTADLAVAQVRNLCIDINIGTPTGTTPTITFYLDRKGYSDGIYYQIETLSTAITAAGTFSFEIGPGFPAIANKSFCHVLGNIIRLRWVVSGTTPSFPNSINIWTQT